MFVPKGILFWVFVSNVIVCFDAFFVINRPETLKGGKYYDFFQPYELYYKYDKLYDMNNDSFVVIQSWLNVCEAIIAFIGVFLSLSSCQGKRLIGAFICLVVTTMVFWKTIIFVWYDHDWLTPEAKAFVPEAILCYYLPSYLWIVFPFLSMIMIPKRIFAAYMSLAKGKTKTA